MSPEDIFRDKNVDHVVVCFSREDKRFNVVFTRLEIDMNPKSEQLNELISARVNRAKLELEKE